MKHTIICLAAITVLASCSPPKYAYFFSHADYQAGKKSSKTAAEASPLAVDTHILTAGIAEQPAVFAPAAPVSNVSVSSSGKTYLNLNKAERRAVRHHLKNEIKKVVGSKRRMDSAHSASASGMDSDLKLAIIFGAVGVVGLAISGDVFHIIGGVCLLIGVVFFVKWIIRQ